MNNLFIYPGTFDPPTCDSRNFKLINVCTDEEVDLLSVIRNMSDTTMPDI